MQVLVEHAGTPATKAHVVGTLTLEQCLYRFSGMNERGWATLDAEWIETLCREGGRYAHLYFTPVAEAARIKEVWEEVLQGKHDTSQGLRPVDVFRDADGAICVAYPGDPGGRWISWETKVSY